MDFISSLLGNPSLKRAAVGGITAGIIALNKKLGLELDTESIMALVGLAIAFIGQSAMKEVKLAGAKAGEAIKTDEDAAKELAK